MSEATRRFSSYVHLGTALDSSCRPTNLKVKVACHYVKCLCVLWCVCACARARVCVTGTDWPATEYTARPAMATSTVAYRPQKSGRHLAMCVWARRRVCAIVLRYWYQDYKYIAAGYTAVRFRACNSTFGLTLNSSRALHFCQWSWLPLPTKDWRRRPSESIKIGSAPVNRVNRDTTVMECVSVCVCVWGRWGGGYSCTLKWSMWHHTHTHTHQCALDWLSLTDSATVSNP